jgi:hypothetical protein
MLEKAVTMKARSVKEVALRRAREWTQELMKGYKYLGTLKKKFSDDSAGRFNHKFLRSYQKVI